MTTEIIIRSFHPNDRDAVRRISTQTAFLGNPATRFVTDEAVLADALTLYFTDHEPESCFVAVQGTRVCGYLLGAKNAGDMEKTMRNRIIPGLLGKIIRRGLLLKKINLQFLWQIAASGCRGEFFAPDFTHSYPALFHINIDEPCRRQHIGTALIDAYKGILRKESVCGVHCGTMSDPAKQFFEKNGFRVLFSGKRSYLRYRVGYAVPYYVMGALL
jgi:ribosomal protein S18 acetylase RimI-like enzyme